MNNVRNNTIHYPILTSLVFLSFSYVEILFRRLPVLQHSQFIFFLYVDRPNFTPKIIVLYTVEFGFLDS
jgi:hypothetical protein